MAKKGIHIHIQPFNEDKLRNLSDCFNLSASNFINTYFEKVSEDEIAEKMTQIIRQEIRQKKDLKIKLDR